MSSAEGNVKICELGGKGWFLPFSDSEQSWPAGFRALLYLAGMVYFFVGISIVSDIFMSSIEAVTSRKRKRIVDGRRITVKVWNDTVATLSLMALGSSAPEIFLSVLELFKKEMHIGDLGPSTITGSAAFNLFVIIGVCVYAIPQGESRSIEAYPTFVVTAFFSVGAYMWLVFILVMRTPDIVDIEEGVLTLVALPLLIWFSYSTDVGILRRLLEKHILGTSEGEDDSETAAAERVCLHFASEQMFVQRSLSEQRVHMTVVRKASGSLVRAECTYRTEPLDAVPFYDYVPTEGTLEFEEGSMEKSITLSVLPKKPMRSSHELLVFLEADDDNVGFDRDTDGGEKTAICTVTIENRTTSKWISPVSDSWFRLDHICNFDSMSYGFGEWKNQLNAALYLGGSPEEQAEASIKDWIFHIIALPWNLVFSLIPPTAFLGGWVCFAIAIIMIGFLTAVVSDMAELFGCVLDIPDIVTAITFVALGTSMPDLFASLSAAAEDPTADASIVNVTGSNSVNVFLGLGVPWTIAALHWKFTGRTDEWVARYPEISQRVDGVGFVVDSRNLGFSVMAFTGCASLALGLLALRRRYLKCELGGPAQPKILTTLAFVILWLGFVTLTSWRVIRCVGASPGHFCKAAVTEQGAVIMSTCFIMSCFTLVAAASIYKHQGHEQQQDDEETDQKVKKIPVHVGEPVDYGIVEGAQVIDMFVEEETVAELGSKAIKATPPRHPSKERDRYPSKDSLWIEVPEECLDQVRSLGCPFQTTKKMVWARGPAEGKARDVGRTAALHPRMQRVR